MVLRCIKSVTCGKFYFLEGNLYVFKIEEGFIVYCREGRLYEMLPETLVDNFINALK